MVLPDPVWSFKLLESSNPSQQQWQLALTAVPDLKFASMKSALKQFFLLILLVAADMNLGITDSYRNTSFRW